MIEIFKIISALSPLIMDNNFIFRENTRNIRNFQIISNENKETVKYGQEITKFRTLSLPANLPEEHKLAYSSNFFKRKIKKRKCETYPCPLCQTFQKDLGFV